jgi:hypothetical protein
VEDQPDDREEVRRLYAELREYEQPEVAEVGARIRAACTTARPEDAEARALAITLDVLRGRRHRDLALALSPSRLVDGARDDGA